MENKIKVVLDGKLIFGLAIIAIGLLFLFQNLGFLTGIDVWELWPVIPILIGLGMLARPRELRQPLGGMILVIIGLLFLLRNLEIIPYAIGELWPIFLILVGLYILKNVFWKGTGRPPASSDYLNMSLILGGGDFKFNSKNFRGGKVDAVMGGGTIDLREADFTEDEVLIETFVIMGGIEIIVPEHWQVHVQGAPLLGGMDNKAVSVDSGKPGKKLIVKATTIMGGLEIKN